MQNHKNGTLQFADQEAKPYVRFARGDNILEVLKGWKLPDPGFLLSFAGGGCNQNDETTLRNLQNSLEYLVRTTGAWITSSASGEVGRFVRSLVNQVESSSDYCPVAVGVFPWTLLESDAAFKHDETYAIEDHFTHFVFVEDHDDVNAVQCALNRHISTTTTGLEKYELPAVLIVMNNTEQLCLYPNDENIATIVIVNALIADVNHQLYQTHPHVRVVDAPLLDYMPVILDTLDIIKHHNIDILRLAVVFNDRREYSKSYKFMGTGDHQSKMIAFSFELENFSMAFELMDGFSDQTILEEVVPATFRRLHIRGTEYVNTLNNVDKLIQDHTGLDVSFMREKVDCNVHSLWSIYLFLWSVIAHKFDPKDRLLKNVEDPVSLLLWLPGFLERNIQCERRREKQMELAVHKVKYDDIAHSIIDRCFDEKPIKTGQMLVRKRTILGEKSLLSLAEENESLVQHPAFQEKINVIWHGKLDLADTRNSHWKIAICLACPLLAYVLLVFDINMQSHVVGRKKRFQIEETNKKSLLKSVAITSWLFVKCPIVIFMYNAFANGVFLIVFAYGLIFEMTSNMRLIDCALYVWVVNLFAEEVRQILTRKHAYRNDSWNYLDIAALLAFSVGEGMRCTSCCFDAGRILLAFDFMLFCARFLHTFSCLKAIGPQIIMVGKMLQDLSHFMVILFVVLVAYAVATQSIMYPNSSPSWGTVIQTLRVPFWNIFGELGLDQLDGADGCTTNETIWRNENVPRCPSDVSRYFIPVMLAVYMLIVQVLFLNLLIAMFNYTFTEVKEKAYAHWCHLRFKLVLEYHDRPWLCQPFSLFAYIWYLLKCIYAIVLYKRNHRGRQFVKIESNLCMDLPRNVSKALDVWERNIALEELLEWKRTHCSDCSDSDTSSVGAASHYSHLSGKRQELSPTKRLVAAYND